MKATITRRLETMDRATQFVLEHPFTPAVPRADVLVTNITTAAATLREWGSDQALGWLSFRAGADERVAQAADLRLTMRDINATATELDPVLYPGVRMLFRMPPTHGYQTLINTARAFVEAIVPVKAAFVERGFAPTFDEALVLKIDALEAAALRKYRGLLLRREGTVNLELVARAGMTAVRELGTIVRLRYRASNPALFEAWKSAARPASAPQTAAVEPEGSTSEQVTPPGPLTA